MATRIEKGQARRALERVGEAEQLVADTGLVATGRKPDTAGLALAEAGLAVTGRASSRSTMIRRGPDPGKGMSSWRLSKFLFVLEPAGRDM